MINDPLAPDTLIPVYTCGSDRSSLYVNMHDGDNWLNKVQVSYNKRKVIQGCRSGQMCLPENHKQRNTRKTTSFGTELTGIGRSTNQRGGFPNLVGISARTYELARQDEVVGRTNNKLPLTLIDRVVSIVDPYLVS